MKGRSFALLCAMVMTCGLMSTPAQAADNLLAQGQQLVEAGKYQEAYMLLEPQEETRAGNETFDLLFGISAVNVGQNTRAIFAFERVLSVDPNNVRARAEIGRAYLAVGEPQSARTELENAKHLGVPADVAQTIDSLLSAVDRLENEGKTTVHGYIEGTVGYDTNVNAAPSVSTIAVPAFNNLPFTLSQSSRAQADWFASLGGGINFSSPIDKQLSIVGGVSGTQRVNKTASDVNMLNADSNLGAMYISGPDVYSLNLQYSTIYLAGTGYREAAGFSAQWQHNLDARNQVSAFAQYSDLSYDGQSIRNADRWVAGGSYAHAWRDGTVGFASAYLVQEKPHDGSANYLGLDGYGLRIGGQTNLDTRTVLFGSLVYENRRGNANDPTFLTARNDEQYIASLSVSRQLTKSLKLTGQYSYTEQHSTIALYQYDRNMISLALRQDF